MTITDEAIRERAYQIWEREGQPHGRDEEHWQQAIEELNAEAGDGSSARTAPDAVAGLDAPAPKRKTTRKPKAETGDAAKPAKAPAPAKTPATKTTRARKPKAD